MALSLAVPVSRAHPVIKAVLKASFPSYRGRKVKVAAYEKPLHVEWNWGGGSIDKVVLIDMSNGKVGRAVIPAPWMHDHGPLVVPPNHLAVINSIFCGEDVGVVIYVNSGSVPSVGSAVAGLLGA